MPLARIVTRHPAAAAGVAERLRAQGYTVEFSDPGDFVVSPADLEVRVDKLPRRQALARALHGDAPGDVYVAPRVVTPGALATAAADVAAGTEGDGEGEGLFGRIRGWMNGRRQRRADEQALVRQETLRQEEAGRNAQLEARVRLEAEQRAAAEARARSQAEREQQERERAAALAMERRRAEEAERERRTASEVERRRAEDVERRRAEEQARMQAERQRVSDLEAEQRRRAEHEREEIERQRIVAAQRLQQQQEEEEYRRRAAEAAERRRQEDEAQRARAAVIAEQRRQERELQNQRLAELEAQHRELQALVAASRAAAERAPVAGPAEPPQVLFTQRAAAAGAAARAHLDTLRRQIPRPSVPPNQRKWAKAAVLAVGISVALMLGWGAAANRQPAAPLPLSKLVSSQNTTEQLPFTNATVHPATPAAKQAVPGQVAVPAPKATPKPAASIPQSDRAPAPRRHARPAADDTVVIHHFSGSAGKAPQPLSADGVKRYSDSGN